MKSYRTLNIILISTWLLLHIGNIVLNVSNWRDRTRMYNLPINKLKPIDPPISTDLPYKKYKEIEVQQRIVRSLKNGNDGDRISDLVGILGTGSGDFLCKTCTIKGPIDFMPKLQQYYYLALRGWKLKSTKSSEPTRDSVLYYVEKAQPYLRKIVVSSETYDGRKTYTAEVKDVPVKFRYSHKAEMLKIPISKQTAYTLKYVFIASTTVIVLFGFYNALLLIQLLINLVGGSSFALNIWWKSIIFLLFFPFFILYIVIKILRLVWSDNNVNWSADEFVFTDYNIFRLRILAYSLTCIPIFFLSLNLLMRLIFNDYFTEDVVINAKVLQPWSLAMDVGFILLLILHIFKQGRALKDEQDLTV